MTHRLRFFAFFLLAAACGLGVFAAGKPLCAQLLFDGFLFDEDDAGMESERLFDVDDDPEFLDPAPCELDSDEDGYDLAAILQVSGVKVGEMKKSARPRYPVAGVSFVWHDRARRRSLPVRVYYPSAQTPEPSPVIVFSHGLGGGYHRCSYLGSAWASRGFVVLLLQHPGSDENVWKGKVRFKRELENAFSRNWSGRTRALDIRFALDRLERLAEEEHWLASKLDLDRVGVGGYDLGALASLLTAGQLPPDHGPSLADSRIRAVLAMSPPVHRGQHSLRSAYSPIEMPTLFISGTEDDGIVGTTKASQRRIPFDFMDSPDRYLVVFTGADHLIYGGHYLSVRAAKDKPFQAAIVRTSICFWQAHLQENDQALSVMRSRALNSLIGLSATVERRLSEDMLPEEKTEEAFRIPEENLNSFPQTRLYRAVLEEGRRKAELITRN